MKEAADLIMIAEVDLMDNNKMYLVKDGQLIEHDLPTMVKQSLLRLVEKLID